MVTDCIFLRHRRAAVARDRHSGALRVPAGDARRQVLRTGRSSSVEGSSQQRRVGGRRRRTDVVESEREAAVGALSQVVATVPAVSRRARPLRTAPCPIRHYRATAGRSVGSTAAAAPDSEVEAVVRSPANMAAANSCLTSLFSTNMAISETKGQGWRAIPTQYRKASDILTSTLAAFCSAATQKGKGIERLL